MASRGMPEKARPRRRASAERGEQIRVLKPYSRNGVMGRVRDAEGRALRPEFRGPWPPAPPPPEAQQTRVSTTEAHSVCDGNPVNVKQEHCEATAESSAPATLRIENFRRPFTLRAVQALVQQCGPMEADGFWMDAIKTHCYVTFASFDVARNLKAAIHGTVWPAETGKELSVSFSSVTAQEVIKNGPPAKELVKRTAPEESEVPKRRVIRGRGAPASIDSCFMKTESKPMLYYLPAPEATVAHRKRTREREWSRQAQQDDTVGVDP